MEITMDSPKAIRRPIEGRMWAGVATGIARYFDVDPVIVRAIFVALTLAGGSGIAIYLACWLTIPAEGEERSAVSAIAGGARRRAPRLGAVIAVGLGVVVASSLLFSRPWQSGWPFGLGGGVTVLAVAGVLTIAELARRRPGRSTLAWVALGATAIVLVVATLASATLLGVTAATGVPLRGGVGERQWSPTSVAELQGTYRLAIGELLVDLRSVDLPEGVTHLHASVAIGRLAVRVPADVDVTVTAHSAAGDAIVFGDRADGVSADRRKVQNGTSGRRLILDAEAGIGEVDIVRADQPLHSSR